MRSSSALAIAATTLVVAIAAQSCASMGKGSASFDVHGMVYDRSGLPVGDVALALAGTAAISDYEGRFTVESQSTGIKDLSASKPGFESLLTKVSLSGPTQIIYVSMISLPELLDMAESSSTARDWKAADAFMARALAVDGKDEEARFLSALLAASPYRSDRDPQKAKAVLDALIGEGFDGAAIRILRADILERDLSDPAGAVADLERYLSFKDDAPAEARLARLKGAVK